MGLKYQLCGLALALLMAGPASADTVFVDLPDFTTPFTVDRTVDGGSNTSNDEEIGQFQFFTQPGSPAYVPLSFYSFCIEPLEVITPGGPTVAYELTSLASAPTNVPGGMGATKAAFLNELFGRFYSDFSIAASPQLGAALQVAIWEIVREDSSNPFNLDAGLVQFSNFFNDPGSVVKSTAASMLAALNGAGPQVNNIFALTNVGAQDVLIQLTPEPSTFLLLGSALTFLGFRRRRRS